MFSRVCVCVYVEDLPFCGWLFSRACCHAFCAEWKGKKNFRKRNLPITGPLTHSVVGPACAIFVTRSVLSCFVYVSGQVPIPLHFFTPWDAPTENRGCSLRFPEFFSIWGCHDECFWKPFSLKSGTNVVREFTEVISACGLRAKVVAELNTSIALTSTARYLKIGLYALDLQGERLQRESSRGFVAI